MSFTYSYYLEKDKSEKSEQVKGIDKNRSFYISCPINIKIKIKNKARDYYYY